MWQEAPPPHMEATRLHGQRELASFVVSAQRVSHCQRHANISPLAVTAMASALEGVPQCPRGCTTMSLRGQHGGLQGAARNVGALPIGRPSLLPRSLSRCAQTSSGRDYILKFQPVTQRTMKFHGNFTVKFQSLIPVQLYSANTPKSWV